jgi:chromosome partitioning protein
MPVIVIANPKGGVGKSTLATNVAGYLASSGRAVMLGDVDKQQSAQQWRAARPAHLAPIQGWDVSAEKLVRPPKGVTHVVIDTPAAMQERSLEGVLRIAQKLLIPLQASLFDIQATHPFVQSLLKQRRASQLQIGLVAMRARENTKANEQLHNYLATLNVPVVAWLRDTQNYVQLAARGLTLWDVAASRVERDLEQWLPLQQWIDA